jgi:starch synthase
MLFDGRRRGRVRPRAPVEAVGGAGMNLVIVASEAVPFAKTGGLADVAGALPRALQALGHQVSLIIPCYRQAWQAGVPLRGTGRTLRVPVGARLVEGAIHEARLPGSDVAVYLIDQDEYFDRETLYGPKGADYGDNCERFVFFSRAAIETARLMDLRPDVIHCNDWQTGLIPIYLREFYRRLPDFAATGTLMTIHNMAYHGAFPPEAMTLTGLDRRLFHWEALEFHGRLNFLKAGLAFADLLNTVSPTYAREIQTPAFGCGLDGLLRARSGDLRGIVNGIDPAVWNPATDPFLEDGCRYGAADPSKKAACKALLQRRAGLDERPDVPLFAQIGRLDPQKGWDLLVRPDREKGWDHVGGVADELLREDVQLVVLGTGQPHYHELLGRLAYQHPGKVRAFLEFSDPLAHLIEAGADVFLMPSLYEPCGLNQLYSLAYGTVPLVRRTGGLADTVVDATPETLADGTATGFAFHEGLPPDTPGPVLQEARERALFGTIQRALHLGTADRPSWRRLMAQGMRADWSWTHSAMEYVHLYEDVRRRAAGRAAG